MNLHLTPDQAAFRDEVRAYIDANLADELRARLRTGLPARKDDIVAWQRILHAKGWAAPHWPRAYGGAELGQAERLILLDELFQAPAPLPQVFNMNMLGPVLLAFGTEAQKREWLPKLANMDVWFCQGFSEPGSGSDLASLRTSARREGDTYVVNGQKIWTTTAHVADYAFCLVRTSQEGRKQEGITFLLVDLRDPGITIRPIVSIDGQHHLNEVFFDEVRVPVDHRIGEQGQGWQCARHLLNAERTGIANVGMCRERLDYALQLALTLREGGQCVLDADPGILAEIAVLDAETRALELTNWRLLLSEREQAENPAFASVLKLKGTDIQQAVAALLMRIGGPACLHYVDLDETAQPASEDLPAARYFYSRAASIYGGTSEIQKDLLSRSILG